MRASLRRATVVVVGVLAACGSPSKELALVPHELLVLGTASGVASIDNRTGDVVASAAQGVTSTDGSKLFATEPRGHSTALVVIDPSSGERHAQRTIPGRLSVRVVSGLERAVALTAPREAGSSPWLPAGRARTEIVVADPWGKKLRRFDLPGNFEPEAFSTDERFLYLIEYLPAMAPERYGVRRMHLATGRIRPVGTRTKQPAPEEMRGTGRMQVWSPDENVLYTLYTKQGPNYAHAPGGGPEPARAHAQDAVHAFVHVLNLAEGWAHCVDLPMPFGTGDAAAGAIAISDDGGSLYVADRSTDTVAAIETDRLRVGSTATADLGEPTSAETLADAGPDDKLYVAGGDIVTVLDAESFEVLERWAMPGPVSGLHVSSDGERLYVGLGDEVIALDASTGRRLKSLDTPGLESIREVVAPAAD